MLADMDFDFFEFKDVSYSAASVIFSRIEIAVLIFALAAIGCSGLFCAVWCMAYRKGNKKCKKIWENKKGKPRKIFYKINKLLLCTAGGMLLFWAGRLATTGVFDYVSVADEHNYKFSSLAQQTEVDILFRNEGSDEWKNADNLQKLHIPKEGPFSVISQNAMKHYMDEMEEVYKDGSKIAQKKNLSKEAEDKKNEAESMNPKDWEEFQTQHGKWKSVSEDSEDPKHMYNSSKAARNAVDLGYASMSDEELLNMGAETIQGSEEFLQYKDRNIAIKVGMHYVQVEETAFYNSKTYQILYREASRREQQKKYAPDFLMLACASMAQAEEAISKGHKRYALVQYYLGILKEKMLNFLSKEDPFYSKTANEALKHYKNAKEAVEENPGVYEKEKNMMKNIDSGVATINTLLGE